MIFDYHIHTPYCGHAKGKTVEYIEKAIELGFDEIGFAEHLGRYYLTRVQRRLYWDWGMDERNLLRYITELSDLRNLYSDRIKIKIGLEIDFIEGAEDMVTPFLDHFTFDYILGAIHCLPRFGWKHLADYKNYDEEEVFAEYFSCARAALRSKLFNSLAHIDFIWRYLRRPNSGAIRFLEEEIAATVQTAAETETCMEINANGYLWSQMKIANGPDPFLALLGEIRNRGVSVTLGSDAHEPTLVGKSFREIIAMLQEYRIDGCMTFTEGKGRKVKLG